MRATDNYLRKHDDPEVIEKRGIFDKVFVREFAKLRQGFEILGTLKYYIYSQSHIKIFQISKPDLRWGVFDETPLKTSGKDSEFYVDPDMPAEKSLTPIKERVICG